jgi:hypothetical protein
MTPSLDSVPFAAEPFAAPDPVEASTPAATEPDVPTESPAIAGATAGAELFAAESFAAEPFAAESFAAESFAVADPLPAEPFTSTESLGMFDHVIDTDLAHGDPPAPIDAPAPSIQDVMPWLVDGPRTETAADPWESFMDDGASETAPTEVSVPPPAPPSAPVQPGWVPASASHSDLGATATRTDVSADPSSRPDPSDTRQGGLARRVPGASLAESRGTDLGAAQAASPSRSADGVRSMLSSFQAGRRRGLDPEPSHESSDPTVRPDPSASPDADASETPNTVHDGRFPQ